MIQETICPTCRNNEPVENIKGAHIEFVPGCIYRVTKFPNAKNCHVYEPKEAKSCSAA